MESLRNAARAHDCAAFVVRGQIDDLREHLEKRRSLIVGLHKPFRDGVRRHDELVVGWHERERYVLTADPARGFTRIDEVGFLAEREPPAVRCCSSRRGRGA